jgi:CHAT domain-containing protein/tetratricopeptide (TPR) repeat protein
MLVTSVGRAWCAHIEPDPPPDAEALIEQPQVIDLKAITDAWSSPDSGYRLEKQLNRASASIIANRVLGALEAFDTKRLTAMGQLLLKSAQEKLAPPRNVVSCLEAHGQFLVGLGSYYQDPVLARRSFDLAATFYEANQWKAMADLSRVAADSALAIDSGGGGGGDDDDDDDVNVSIAADLDLLASSDRDAASTIRKDWSKVRALIEGTNDSRWVPPACTDREVVELYRVLLSRRPSPDVVVALALAGAGIQHAHSQTPDILVDAGTALVRRGELDAALRISRHLAELDPTDPKAAFHLAEAYAEMGEPETAKDTLAGLVGTLTGEHLVSCLRRLVFLAHETGDPDGQMWQSRLRIATAFARSGQLMPEQPGDDDDAVYQVVLARVEGGKVIPAPGFERLDALQRNAHVAVAQILHNPINIVLLHRAQEWQPAHAEQVTRLLVRAIGADGLAATQHIALGETRFARKEYASAAQEYLAALKIRPDHWRAALYVGDCFYQQYQYHLARAFFAESLAIRETPQAWRFLGDALRRTESGRGEAEAAYVKALKLDPDYDGARIGLREVRTASQEEELTDDVLRQAIARWFAPTPKPMYWQSPPMRDRPARAKEPDDEANGPGSKLVNQLRQSLKSASYIIDALVEEEEAFEEFLRRSISEELTIAITISYQLQVAYGVGDRDVSRALWLAERQLRVAEALPESYTPSRSPIGHGRRRHVADACGNLAEQLERVGRLEEAFELLQRALDLLRTEERDRNTHGFYGLSHRDRVEMAADPESIILSHLARLAGELNDKQSEAAYSAQATQRRKRFHSDDVAVGEALARSRAADATGNMQQALHFVHLAKALVDNAASPHHKLRAKVLNALAARHARLGLLRSALASINACIALNSEHSDSRSLSKDHLNRAETFRTRPDLGDVEVELRTALKYVSARGGTPAELRWYPDPESDDEYVVTYPEEAWTPLDRLASLYEDRGDLPSAAGYLAIAAALSDHLRVAAISPEQRVLVRSRLAEAYSRLIAVYVRMTAGHDTVRHAWQTAERFRARTLLDSLAETPLAVPSHIPANMVDREKELMAARRSALSATPPQFQKTRRITDELEQLWAGIEAMEPGADAYVNVRRSRPASLDEVCETLRTDQPRAVSVISFAFIDEKTIAVFAVEDEPSSLRLATRELDRASTTSFITANLGSAGPVRHLARDLSDLLQFQLSPLTDAICSLVPEGNILAICPIEPFQLLPFAVLGQGPDQLVSRNPIVSLPSASTIRAIRVHTSDAAARPGRTTVLGDPSADLEDARSEALTVADQLGTKAFLGPDATRDAMLAALADSNMVHFAGHAFYDGDDPLASGLVLADGTLSAYDVLARPMASLELVSLSGCESSISHGGAAEDMSGLVRSILVTGARSVVGSLWRVADRAAKPILTTFYNEVLAGAWKVDALRSATLLARDLFGEGRFDLWGGFGLTGDWR